MNYGGNMPDWHQYNSTQPIGSEVPPVGQNANHSPIFGPTISPRRLNGPTFSPEGLSKPQNDTNFNPRNFQQSPNTLNRPNVPPENSSMGSAVQISGCHGPYGVPSPRNIMIEGTSASLDSRNMSSGSLNEAISHRNHQISMNRPAAHLNCPTINGSMAPVGQRHTPTSLQGPIPTSSRQGSGSYIACKLPCCNPDPNISYQSWEKFGPYPPNMPYRDTGYPVDNRRFGNDCENREQLGTGAYNIDPRRNFPDYKYRKDSIIPRSYAHSPSVIQSYPIQNYNFPADYQKYPAYPIKEYPRDSPITNPQNPGVLKYQEQSVIVQQKYFTKQIQYQNGVIPKSIVPPNMTGNVISRAQNPYFNPQLARDFPRSYADSTPLANRGIQTTNPIHAAYPKYQMYQQKIAMQRFSMENHLRELTRIPGYQSHPKYQESVLRYRELLRLQQTVDYQSTAQDAPKVVTSQVNDEIPPINLQFDQNGMLINSSFAPPGFSTSQSPSNLQNSKNAQSVSNTEVGPLNLQQSIQFKTQASIDNHLQDQESSSVSQPKLSHKNDRQYSTEKDQLQVEKYESESLNVPNSDDGKTSSMHQRNSRDFADKPELDVRQFLANWDESEDEDGTNANLPDVVLSNSTSGVVEYENTKAVPENPEESEICSETEDCRDRDNCGMFENTQNETKPSNSTDNQIYQCDLPPGGQSIKYIELDSDISDSGKKPVRTGTVIQPTSTGCENQITLHIMENMASGQTPQSCVKLLREKVESSNNTESQELIDKVKGNVIVKKESSIEEETITSIKEHINAYNQETDTEIRSSIEKIIENNDDSRSSSGKESYEHKKLQFSSDEDLSESDDSNSTDSDSISSFIKSPKTIKGTEIHIDAQELSTICVAPKNDSEILDGTNLQKQNSFASEESHNPDDISLPDLPTSECTPISTTLNTPIHSDSEESSEPVIDLTTPANPIEIIQNSPMLSFTHSPIKMEPYEHLDENDLTDKVSHDALNFEFQASNSCDNDCEKLSDVSSHTTEQYNIAQNDENTLDSDCVEILSEKAERKIEINTCEVETKNDDVDNITKQNRFTFNKESVMITDKANTTVNADHQPWPSVTIREHKHQISNNTEYQDAKSDTDKLETLSEMTNRLSIMSEVTKDHLKDDTEHVSSAKNDDSTNKWHTKCETENVKFESTENNTALNLVKDENKVKSDLIKVTDGTTNLEIVAKLTKSCSSNSNEGINFKHSNQSACNSSMKTEVIFTSTERTVGYVSPSQEDKIFTESIENQSNFTGSLNIPLIPGEDFEEPKMPVLPMEGNCLTKIIKNTSPITDLDVLGSDDEKLDKMDEIWMEVGGVETVGKVTDVNVDTYAECRDGCDREKNLSSRNKPRALKKKEWKCLKNSIKPKDPSKLFGRIYNDSEERDLESNTGRNSHLYKSPNLRTAQDFESTIISGTDNTVAILQEKHNFTQVPIISEVTSHSSIREDCKQNHDICLENNATEILKCQEKANHINDIATKLLENARLFEPELRKMEVRRKESSSVENSRDGSKRRIKLLKEFRKVKNKINIDRPGIQSAKSADAVENDVVSSIEITEQCKEVDTETKEVKNEIKIIENAFTSTIENVLRKSDSLIVNSRSTLDSQTTQKVKANTNENTLHTISTDIAMPGEKLRQILTDSKATLKIDDSLKENCNIVNMKDSITVEDSNSVNSHNRFDIKVVSPIEENINECAINLSKSSDDFGLPQTVIEKGCVTNDSYNSYTSEHMKIEECTEIASKSNKELNYTETKDDSPISLQSSHSVDSGFRTEIVEECDNTMKINHILEENTKQEIDAEPIRTDEHEEPEKLLSNPEKVDDLANFCERPEKIVNSILEYCKNSTHVFKTNDVEIDTFVSKQCGGPELNELVAFDNKDQKPTNRVVNSEITCNADTLQNIIGGTSTVNEKESKKLMDNFDSGIKNTLSCHSPEEEISSRDFEDLMQNTRNVSEETVVEAGQNCISTTSVPDKERNISKLSVTQQLMVSEPMVNNDRLMNIQKFLEDSNVTTDIHTESKVIDNDLEIIEKPLIVNESLVEMQLKESTETETSQNNNLESVPGTDKILSTVDANFEAFGLENSFNYDFSNFDVAPNFSNTADTDQSNNWKYSKAYARFEDCERYKNPDNFVNPILTSLETLDNLNTVPVYTTKDGKITYSPNPKFTYRALIMEAREREGYPALRKSYCGNSRAQESLHYGTNQTSFRKRKNSEAHSYSGSRGKKNYFEYYEPSEHGESSMKNVPKPWNRTSFSHNKYSYQSRERNSHYLTSYNSDAEKKNTTERIGQEKVSSKYKDREGCTVFDVHNNRKNGTSDGFKCNNKKQYSQSTEQLASDSAWSGSKRNSKCNQNSSEITLSRLETNKMTDNKRTENLKRTVSTEKYMNNWKNGNRSKDVQPTEKFTSASDENEHITKSCTNILPTKTKLSLFSDTLSMGKMFPEARIEEFESSFPKTESKPSNDHNLQEISNCEANQRLPTKLTLFSSEWEDNYEILTVQQRSSYELKIPTVHLLDKINEVCDKETKVNELYNEIDDICQSKTSDINENKFDDTDLSNNKCVIPSNSIKSLIENEKFKEPDGNQEKLNIDGDESIINNAGNQDASHSIPVEIIRTDEDTGEQKIPEIQETPSKNEPEASFNERVESIREEDKFDELLHCTDDQMNLNSAENCASEVKDIDHDDLLRDEIHVDTENEVATSNQISKVQDNLVTLRSNDQISYSSEELCSIKETDEIERKEQKIKPENNKNGTSIKHLQPASNISISFKMMSEYENTSKPQSQFENYIAYSPSNESPEDTKAIPKLVIKKTDSLNCKNICPGPSLATSHDVFAEKVSDKEEHSCKVSVHPKIPKILIRNAKSRPSTPSIEEVTEKKTFSVTTKEDNKVPKVKIRFEEKRPRSPAVSSNENVSKTDATETKIPKMKIKLEDKLPKVIIEKFNTESCGSKEEVQKTIPKMKIKKFKGALRQIMDTQILPVSIPRMFIYTELESDEKTTPQMQSKEEGNTSENNLESVIPNSIQEDQKTVKETDLKKVPKLKIKRQSSGCSVDLNRKRHSVSPIEPELKKVKKYSKLAELHDKKQFNKLSVGSEHRDSSKRLDTFSVKQSYELASSESVKYTTAAQSGESVRGEQLKSSRGNVSGTPEEIPKVIIKRVSPSAEFKCELSKVRRDAIIKNKRWQPEVKLQRSWVLDCMAKDLNLDKLRLKLATPNSILKKCSLQKESKLGESHVKNGNLNTNQSEKKLFRSKSTSELVPVNENAFANDDVEQLNETNPADLPRELITPKRCKSDLGSTFSKYSENFECDKKLRHNNHSSIIQLTSKPMLNYVDDFINSSSIHSVEPADMVAEKYQAIKDLNATLNSKEIQSNNEVVHLMETSERSQDKTLGENMNSKTEILASKINSLPLNNETSNSSFVDLNLNSKTLSGPTNNTNSSNSNEITNIFVNDLKMDETHRLNDSHLHYSATKCKDIFEVSKDSVIVKNTNVHSVKRHTKYGEKHINEIGTQVTEKDKTMQLKNNSTSSMTNMSTNYINEKKSCKIFSTSTVAHDGIDRDKTVIDNTRVPGKSVILQTPTPDINVLKNNSEICSCDPLNTVDNLEIINCKNNIHKLDINDNSDGNLKEADDNNVVSENLISCIDIIEQENTSTLNENVLVTSVINKSKSTDSDVKDAQNPKIYINLNNRSANAIDSDLGNSVEKLESCEESQTILEILSASPNPNQTELEIPLCPDVIEENGICLYHEDAIPTQFELELEIIDNIVPDPLEVPMPQNNQPTDKFQLYPGNELNEDSHQSSRISDNLGDSVNLDDSKSETGLSDENISQVCSVTTYQRGVFAYTDKQDTNVSVDSDKRNSTSNARMKTIMRFDSNVEKPSSCSDLLAKEVLAAKERLRKCLYKSKNGSRSKFKARPKTAAEKKQGSSFDLNTLVISEDSSPNLENHSLNNMIAEANSSKQMDTNFSSSNNDEKSIQNQTKTEFNVNKIKSERKHSKGSKNNLIPKKYSSLPTNIEKYTNLVQLEGYLIPKHSSMSIKDRVEFSKGGTTISLKNSKYLMKNHSCSDARKKMSELINSKDSKCRFKSSRNDVNSKYVEKLKSSLPNIVVQATRLDIGLQSEEQSVSDAANHKYKSFKTSLDQNVNSMTDKAKFKLYKIPKITKPSNPENERLIEELRESHSKEARMPILEPQVDLNGGLEVSELSSDRETSRSPPVITNQESRPDYETTTWGLECQVSFNQGKEVPSKQRSSLFEKEVPEAMPSYGEETTVADIVNDMAYHEKATIRHRRYCTLCERWFPTVARYKRHLSGYQHRHTELTQRRTIHALFTLFTGRPCPRLQPPGIVRIDCEPGELTPLQIAVQGVTKESNKVNSNIKKPTTEDK